MSPLSQHGRSEHDGIEVTILVRVDDMGRGVTLGQRSVRFPLTTDGHPIPVPDLVYMALKQAPSVNDWQAT